MCAYLQTTALTKYMHTCTHFYSFTGFSFKALLNFKLQQVYPSSVNLSLFHLSVQKIHSIRSGSRWSLPRCQRLKVMNKMLLLINEIFSCSFHFLFFSEKVSLSELCVQPSRVRGHLLCKW